LNIKNTGHDFIGKSTGAGALSIWTHFLRDIQYLGDAFVDVAGRSGSAFKVGAGVTVGELYQAANDTGLQVTGGIARVSIFASCLRSCQKEDLVFGLF
jgi:hypothetical protein